MIDRRQLEIDLARAVADETITAHFQPQFEVKSGRMVAAEALCRWSHPVVGGVSPGVFIPIAEDIGLIHDIGRFMIEESCRAAAEWQRLSPGFGVSVNVSAVQLESLTFFDEITDALERNRVEPDILTIEITETQPILDLPTAVLGLDRLRLLGIGVSIDDFGIGHSSLEQLASIPATEVKIDRLLVQDDTDRTRAVVSDVVAVAHDRGLCVVGEGIETEAHLWRAQQWDCDRVQGFMLGMPQDRTDFERLLAA